VLLPNPDEDSPDIITPELSLVPRFINGFDTELSSSPLVLVLSDALLSSLGKWMTGRSAWSKKDDSHELADEEKEDGSCLFVIALIDPFRSGGPDDVGIGWTELNTNAFPCLFALPVV
jgi:hypothetical protein